jgi:predicted nuclease with RNAse H fold
VTSIEAYRIYVGVDVGGSRKGFHAVALASDGSWYGQQTSKNAVVIADWCRAVRADVVAVDAPCAWSLDGRARPAERQLAKAGIHCFSSPSRDAALGHPKDNFGWMFNGEALYEALETSHPLSRQADAPRIPSTVETYPQAAACALAGHIVSAKQKRAIRRGLLQRLGLDVHQLTNIDLVDAAICAVVARATALGKFKNYGEPTMGFIRVPTED